VALDKERNAENDDKDDDLHPKAEMEMEWRR
jgi:hypothetical protein